ncbi:MAG: PAS domain-containing protein [Anaerolineae bacterium]|nr:PAS domain-containing protein [Anaerolineae bacterium]
MWATSTRRPFAFFADQKIGVKILAGYLVALTLATLVGGLAVIQLDQVNSTVGRLTNQLAQERALAEETAVQIYRIRLYANQYMLQGQKPADLDTYNHALNDAQDLLNTADQIVAPSRAPLQQHMRERFDKFAAAFAEIVGLLASRQELVDNSLTPQGAVIVDKLANLRNNSFESLDFTSAHYASQARDSFSQVQVGVVQYLATGNESLADKTDEKFAAVRATFDLLKVSARDAASRAVVAEISLAAQRYYDAFQTVRQAVKRQQTLITNQLDVYGPEVDQIATDIVRHINDQFAAQSQATNTLVIQMRVGVLVTIALVIAIGVVLGLAVSRAITRPIAQVAAAAQGIADGALNQEIPVRANDELGVLARAFNHMTAALQQSLASLQTSEARFRRIFEYSRISLWETDFSAVRNYLDQLNPGEAGGWHSFFHNNPDVLRRVAALAQIVGVNKATLQLFQIENKADFQEKRFGLLFPETAYANFADLLVALLNGEPVFETETTLLTIQGDPLNVILRVTVIPSEEPWKSVLVSAIDITDRKQIEEELRHTRNYLDNILNSMPSVLIGVDVQGRINHWNAQAARLSGIPREQALDQPLETLLPRFAKYVGQLREAIQTRQPCTLEKVETRTPDDRGYADIMIFPLVANGVEGAVIRVDDITEKVRVEQLMVQTEKMTMIGGLAAGMAHEINNPLGAILQGAQNIERRLSLDLPANHTAAAKVGVELEQVRAYLEQREILQFLSDIRESGARAAKIVSSMLQFSRRSDSQWIKTSIADLLDHAVELAANDYDLKKKYDFRHIAITRDYDLALPPVPIIPNEIEQVFLNLLKNAAHALMDRPESVTPHIHLRTYPKDSWAVIEVTDNGCGMDESVQKRIFEPFFTTKAVGMGTGLGLPVSYTIITDSHKGAIEAESVPDQGTTFTIRLPLERTP